MSAFLPDDSFLLSHGPTAKRRKKRRPDTVRLLAIDFEVAERTLRRWIARPELRPVLRARRRGKQWRLDVPSTDLAFARYKRDVLRAISPFRRRRHARYSPSVKKIARSLGYDGNRRRERDLRILRLATQLKIANARQTSVFKAKSKLAERTHSDRSADHIFETRIIAAKYGCDVFNVPKYFDLEKPTHENKNLFRRMRQSWPARSEWDKASSQFESLWRKRTLTEAAHELAKKNRPITGESLAPLLFLNHDREWAWKANEKQKDYLNRHPGDSVMFDPYGRRGISLRLFRSRYESRDILEAKVIAEGVLQSEELEKPEKDRSGFATTSSHRKEDQRKSQQGRTTRQQR